LNSLNGGRAETRRLFVCAGWAKRWAGGDHGRKEAVEIANERIDWAAARAEYLAGSIGQRELAQKYGTTLSEVSRRSKAEDWVALRNQIRAEKAGTENVGKAQPEEVNRDRDAEKRRRAGKVQVGDREDVKVARKARKALLQMLERAAETIPCDATEVKTTAEDGAVKLLKLRDLTAAYKELVGDLPEDGEPRETRRVVIDV
jgi:hypothetical protein